MSLGFFAKLLAQNGQIVEKLANTYFMRRLAQLTYYGYRKATDLGQNAIEKAAENERIRKLGQEQPSIGRLTSFARTFIRKLQEEFEKANRFR